jgi:hypothetical protein
MPARQVATTLWQSRIVPVTCWPKFVLFCLSRTPHCPHWGQPMKLVGISRLLGRSCPTLLELYCAPCDHEEIKEDRPAA